MDSGGNVLGRDAAKNAMSMLTNISGKFTPRESAGPRPARDWLMLIALTGILLTASVLWNVWFFDRLVREGVQANTVPSASVDTSKAGEVEALFAERATTSAAYKTLYPFIDPSR